MDNQGREQKKSLWVNHETVDRLINAGFNINKALKLAKSFRSVSTIARAVPFFLSPAGITLIIVILVVILFIILPMLLVSGSSGLTGAGPYELQK